MNILELFENDKGYRTEKDDNTTIKLGDLRKTKLTLAQINRIRVMNDIRKLEHEQKIKEIQTQYKQSTSEPMAPM